MSDKINYIFFNNNFENRTLAMDIFKKQGSAGIIFIENESAWADKASMEFLNIVKPKLVHIPNSPLFLSEVEASKLFVKNTKFKLFFLSKNESRNTSLAFYMMNLIKKVDVDIENLDFYVSPDWDDIEGFLTDYKSKIFRNYEIHLINTARLSTNALIAKFRPIDILSFDELTAIVLEDFNVALLGFNDNTKEALFRMYQSGRFEGSDFNLDIYDISVELKTKSFRSKYEGFLSDVNLDLYTSESYESLYENILENLSKYQLVIIDVADEKQNEFIALKLQEKLLNTCNTKTTLAVHIRSENSILNNAEENPSIVVFGLAKDIFNLETILLENYFNGAKFVNEYYNSLKLDPMKLLSWKSMDAFKKNSNMSVADFNSTFVELIGRKRFMEFKSSQEFRQYLSDNPVKYENLSRTEHFRWIAFLFSNGWNVLPLEGDVMIANKDDKKKLHTCLVAFDDLDKVSDLFGEDYKKYDSDNIDIVYDIYQILNKGGL